MNLEFSEEQQLLTNMVEKFTANCYGDNQRHEYLKSDQGFSTDNWQLMAETGILSIPFSESYGGLGGSAEDLASVMQPLGKAVAVEPVLSGVTLAGNFLNRAGTESQKSVWIPKIISGESQLALAHIEIAARYDLSHIGVRYDSDNQISGRKTFVLGAGAADGFIVSAIANGTETGDEDEIRFFLVENDAPGLIRRNYRLVDGSVACELEFQNVMGAPMLGSFKDLLAAISLTKIAACAEMIGLMEIAFESTLEHLKTREQFGRPLSSMQALQHRLADAYLDLELCRSHLIKLAALEESDPTFEKTISGSKAFISKRAVALAEEAVQLHGGMGITDELIVGHAMKRILLLSTLFGDVDAEMRRYS